MRIYAYLSVTYFFPAIELVAWPEIVFVGKAPEKCLSTRPVPGLSAKFLAPGFLCKLYKRKPFSELLAPLDMRPHGCLGGR